MWISSHLRALVICCLLSVIWLLVAGLWERGRAHGAWPAGQRDLHPDYLSSVFCHLSSVFYYLVRGLRDWCAGEKCIALGALGMGQSAWGMARRARYRMEGER